MSIELGAKNDIKLRLCAAIQTACQKEVSAAILAGGDAVAELRKLFDAVSDTRNFGFCCDHITTEDANCDDSNVDYCIERAQTEGHFDCLAMMCMLRAIDDEDLRLKVLYMDGTE